MHIENLIICPDRELDVRTSSKVINLLKGVMGIYQTSYKLMNQSCHALKVKYDPDYIDEAHLRQELNGLQAGCKWRFCRPGDGDCKDGCKWSRCH